MQLVLAILFGFVFIGLVTRRFDRRQQTLIVAIAIALAVAQYTLPRFL